MVNMTQGFIVSDVHSQSSPEDIIMKNQNNVTDPPEHTY